MDSPHLYQQIVAAVRQEILSGHFKPGDRLPSVREMTSAWGCTPGTVQRAYVELARQGLVVSRAGQGTHVVDKPAQEDTTPLRRAQLIHRAQAFLLETLTAGYTPEEVESALRIALDHWRTLSLEAAPVIEGVLRFAGSHDPAMTWLAAHFPEIIGCADHQAHFTLQLSFSGSLGGLIALAEGKADLAGCHLWDQESDTYNAPFVRRVLPGRRVALVTLAHRRLGLILPSGNPQSIHALGDLGRPGLRFVNRQAGSGTRVWLDAALREAGVNSAQIHGYQDEQITHSAVANRVAEGATDVGFGLETAARAYGLDFISLVLERYDLVILEEKIAGPCIQSLVEWLAGPQARQAIQALGGYEVGETGKIEWVE